MEHDFGGYATKVGLKCSDGRTIMPDAFKDMDGKTVPLVWQHGHDSPQNILGHAELEVREDGVYSRGFFNDTEWGQSAKALVKHEDITMLSIYANKLIERGKQVFHGVIREVSLVLSGANPGATIDYVNLAHSEDGFDPDDDELEAIITTGLTLEHADNPDDKKDEDMAKDDTTVKDVYDSMTKEQQDVVAYLVGAALNDAGSAEHSDDENNTTDDGDGEDEGSLKHQEGNEMSKNVFEQQNSDGVITGTTLTHSQLEEFKHSVFDDFKKTKSLKEAILAHAGEYGITNIETLFPDAKVVNGNPEWITRKMEWVDGVLNGTRKLPFARIKSRSADLTYDTARANGYIKGNMKKEQFFAISGRETTPTTIYKKQKLDRDDIVDITEFDVVNWIWQEMRFMLREEIARAILVGDGRPVEVESAPNPDKIDESKIRPIAKDDDFYAHRVDLPANTTGENLIEAVLRARKNYKGSGNPTFYTTEDLVTDLLLLKDKMGRRLYPTEAELKSALRVSNIVTVDIMENVEDEETHTALLGVMVNMSDYSIGTDKGGEITTFDDFDIDYNQYKYLIEGRMSGALTQHKTALVFWRASGTQATVTAPTFDSGTNTVTIPSATGVIYSLDGVEKTAGDYVITADATVTAVADDGYYIETGTTTSWNFTFNESA